MEYKCKKYEFVIIDTSGLEEIDRELIHAARGAEAILSVYDPSNELSAKDAIKWIEQFRREVNSKIYSAIIRNKIGNGTKASTEQMKSYAEKNNCSFFSVSSRTGEGVRDMFNSVFISIIESYLQKL